MVTENIQRSLEILKWWGLSKDKILKESMQFLEGLGFKPKRLLWEV